MPNLNTEDQSMMKNSDNRLSHAIYDYFQTHTYMDNGQSVTWPVSQEIQALGLSRTELLMSCDHTNHPNSTSLRDLATMFEAGYLRTDVLDATRREEFKANMLTSNWASYLYTMIVDERTKMGLTSDSFETLVMTNSMGKGGAIESGGTLWRGNAGLVALPADPSNTAPSGMTYFEWGSYYKAQTTGDAQTTTMDDLHNTVWVEAFRPSVHDALTKWRQYYVDHGMPL